MAETKAKNKHFLLSIGICICGLIYIFAYQFKLPVKADLFLYGMLAGLFAMTFFDGKFTLSTQSILFILLDMSAIIGLLYTTRLSDGIREAKLFIFFAGAFIFSSINTEFVKLFAKWIYLISIVMILSVLVQFIDPAWFNAVMRGVMQPAAHDQLLWSYGVDNAYAGLAAYTPYTTFSATIVFGHAFLAVTGKGDKPIIKNKVINIALMVLSVFAIIMCSKRGLFVATFAAMFILMLHLYRGQGVVFKLLGVAAVLAVIMFILYKTNDFVSTFIDRFLYADDFSNGRDSIYKTLLEDFFEGNIFIGRGTAATYKLATTGAHNIYIQMLYDHGIIFAVPYYLFLGYNYYSAFKNNSPLSIFVQTVFLVYGMSGNPFYSNAFMLMYIYHVLYALDAPKEKTKPSVQKKSRYIK